MKHLYWIPLFIVLSCDNSYADVLIDIGSCYTKSYDIEQTRNCLEQVASKDNAEAQYQLGRYLFLYSAVFGDDEAESWLQKAAQQNNQKAKLLLQVNYNSDTLTEEETKSAWDLLIKDAESGNPEDQYFIGYLYSLSPNNDEGINKNAEKWLKIAAEKGLPQAQVKLGWLYESAGTFGFLNKDAEKWYLIAAEKNYTDAEYSLGRLYQMAAAFDENVDSHALAMEAEKWLLKAATKSDSSAMSSLGSLYSEGYGFSKDYKKALDWYLKAITEAEKQNNSFKKFLFEFSDYSSIAQIYSEGGYGINKDLYKARDWYHKAAEAGDSEGIYQYALMAYQGDGGSTDYKEASKWFQKLIEESSAFIDEDKLSILPLYLGEIYYYGGHGIEQDYIQAKQWYEKAIKSGYLRAYSRLGFIDYFGFAGTKDYAHAKEMFLLAANEGDSFSQLMLGEMARKGEGISDCEKIEDSLKRSSCNIHKNFKTGPIPTSLLTDEPNYLEAKTWYSRAASQGIDIAQYQLGLLYLEGKPGIVQDYQEARKWFLKAATQGHLSSQFKLGLMSFDGLGIPKNYAEAVKWFAKVANTGDSGAQFNLGLIYSEGGFGLVKNYIHSHKWFNIAAANGNYRAADRRKKLESKMTIAQINEAQKLARVWKPH